MVLKTLFIVLCSVLSDSSIHCQQPEWLDLANFYSLGDFFNSLAILFVKRNPKLSMILCSFWNSPPTFCLLGYYDFKRIFLDSFSWSHCQQRFTVSMIFNVICNLTCNRPTMTHLISLAYVLVFIFACKGMQQTCDLRPSLLWLTKVNGILVIALFLMGLPWPLFHLFLVFSNIESYNVHSK